MKKQKRKYERNKVWPETEAHLEFTDKTAAHPEDTVLLKTRVDNLSVSGMFVITQEQIPVDTDVFITIDFEPGGQPPNVVRATGTVVRMDEAGLAIQFKDIDAQRLGESILAKLRAEQNS